VCQKEGELDDETKKQNRKNAVYCSLRVVVGIGSFFEWMCSKGRHRSSRDFTKAARLDFCVISM